MNGIEKFIAELDNQRKFLDECREFDDCFGNVRTRTQQDLNRQRCLEEADNHHDGNPPTAFETTVQGRIGTRVKTAFKVFALFDRCENARREAIKFCQQHPESIVDEPAMIREFVRIHNELLRFTRDGFDQAAITCELEWQLCRSDLEQALNVLLEFASPADATTDKHANHSQLFPNGGPTNHEVRKLAVLLDENEPLERGQKTELARKITGGNSKKATNLLSALRKQQNLDSPTVRKFQNKE